MKIYTFDIAMDDIEISNVRRTYRTDVCGFGMEDFHCGMPDLEYDKFVPYNFGREEE